MRILLLSTMLLALPLSVASDTGGLKRVYSDVTKVTPFFEQGKVIFNTSMPNDGTLHLFTDNRGFTWGPTAVYQRTADGEVRRVMLEGASIPADIHITPDGNTLYFADYGVSPSRVFVSQHQDGSWQTPQLFEALPAGSGYMTSTDDGEIIFSNNGDLFILNNDEISKLPGEVNSDEGEHDPFIAQDGSFLLFVRQDSQGDSNMYLSIRTNNGWTAAERLPAPFNDDKVDGSPYVTPDKQYLFFSSNRGSDILRTWQVPFANYLKSKLKTVKG